MKKYFLISFVSCIFAISIFSICLAAGSEKKPSMLGGGKASSQGLTGNWKCQGDYGTVSLAIEKSKLVFDGEPAPYTLSKGAMRVQEEGEDIDYPYSLKGDLLTISLPEGGNLQCQRQGEAPSKGQAAGQPPSQRGGTGVSGGGENLLQGTFCHWSGSSGYSSYSSTRWARFDGRGNFTYGGESSFSSDAGMYSGGGGQPEGGGTYRVSGNTINLTYTDGSTDTATVYNKGAGGAITEVMFDGKLYAPALCE